MSYKDLIQFIKKRKIHYHLLFWIGMFGYYVSSDWGFTATKMALIEKFTIKVSLQIILSYVIVYFLMPQFLAKKRRVLFILSSLFAVYVVHILYTASRTFYLELKYPDFFKRNDFFECLVDFYLYFVNITWFIFPTIILVAFKYYERQKEVLILKEEKKITELNALKNQLNPHFLFNTLNNLYTLSLKKSDKAPAVIMKLSKILDYMLYHCKDDFVPLSAEVTLLNNYIALEKLRYGKRLNITFDYDIAEEAQIAPLLLLTFVENAFKHGVSQEIKVANIQMRLQARDDRIRFEIENSKSAHQAVRSDENRSAIGLENSRKQLDILYGQTASLNTEETEKMYSLTLELPIHALPLSNHR